MDIKLLLVRKHNLYNLLKTSTKFKNGENKCRYGSLSCLQQKPKDHGKSHHLPKYNAVQASYYGTLPSPQQLLVKSFGEPKEVVVKESFDITSPLEGKQVLVKMLACPINPADINTIQGVYAIKPKFPFIPGNEGLMEVVDKGKDVKELNIGDKIIPRLNAMGTWRTMAVVQEEELIKIPLDIDRVTGSTIAVNPCTAYRMLKDFVNLNEGDFVIQNCANSAVGEAVIQIAAARSIQTINVIRDRPDFNAVEDHLKFLGGTLVIRDTDLRTRSEKKKFPTPRLALNGVSGRPGTDVLRQLTDGGTMVTYGGMSRQPLTVPVGSLIFNDVILRGFWMTRWNKQHERDPERVEMLNDIFDLVRKGKFQPPPHILVAFEDYISALENAMPSAGMIGKKQILIFS